VRRPPQLWSAGAGALVVASALALACTESSAPRKPRTVAALSVTDGSRQEAEVGTPLRNPIAFLARDSAGSPVWGATVRFSATAVGSAVNPTTAETGRDGIARVRWTLGSEAATQSLVAAAGRSGEDVTTTVTATARPGAAVTLRADIGAGPVAVTVGDTTAIVFRGADRFGNDARRPAAAAHFAWSVDHPEVGEVVATEEVSAADPPYLRARVVGRGVGSAVLEAAVTGLGAGALHFRFDLRAYAGPGRDLAFASPGARRGQVRIYVLSADGMRLTDLGDGSYPAWPTTLDRRISFPDRS
jgi:hypothetical protein